MIATFFPPQLYCSSQTRWILPLDGAGILRGIISPAQYPTQEMLIRFVDVTVYVN